MYVMYLQICICGVLYTSYAKLEHCEIRSQTIDSLILILYKLQDTKPAIQFADNGKFPFLVEYLGGGIVSSIIYIMWQFADNGLRTMWVYFVPACKHCYEDVLLVSGCLIKDMSKISLKVVVKIREQSFTFTKNNNMEIGTFLKSWKRMSKNCESECKSLSLNSEKSPKSRYKFLKTLVKEFKFLI